MAMSQWAQAQLGPTRPAPHHLGSPPGRDTPEIRTWSTWRQKTAKPLTHDQKSWQKNLSKGVLWNPQSSLIQWLLPGSHSEEKLGRQHCFMPAAADAKSPWQRDVSDLQNMAVGWCPRLLPNWFITPITRAYGGAIYIYCVYCVYIYIYIVNGG